MGTCYNDTKLSLKKECTDSLLDGKTIIIIIGCVAGAIVLIVIISIICAVVKKS